MILCIIRHYTAWVIISHHHNFLYLYYSLLFIPQLSFIPELGRKGKCGYLKKVRGGVFSSWRWRLVVAHDSYIATYIPGNDGVDPTDLPEEVLRIDSGLVYIVNGRYIEIKSNSGSLSLCAYTRRQANEWKTFLSEFYNVKVSPRMEKNAIGLTSFPSRCSAEEVEAFHCSRNYYHSLAVQLLNATSDIFIMSAELSPTVLLTRPPLPPIRLDQILGFKANQGIRIYIMINRESNPSIASHNSATNSYEVKAYLQNLSLNIKVIRITKSAGIGIQHEKVVVIDRVVAFTGSFDLNFGQYDDFAKSVEDESGVMFPGHDYVQPCSNMLRPTKTVSRPTKKSAGAQQEQQQGQQQLPTFEANDSFPILSNIIEEERVGEGVHDQQKQNEEKNSADLHDADAPPGPLSMYQSTPFPYLQQQHGEHSESYRTTNNDISFSEPSMLAHQEGVEEGINQQMTSMFSDEDVDAAEEEARLSRASSQSHLSTGNSVVTTSNQAGTRKKTSLRGSLLNVLSHIGSGIEEAVTSFFQEEPFIDTREEYPRQPWHGVHVQLKGIAARDLSSHFIQKWRRHKSNSTQMDACVVQDITDDVYRSVCARCKHTNLFEDASVCPNCSLPLGRVSKYSQAYRTQMEPRCMPMPPTDYSYIVFECHFASKIGCLLHGQGPVAVEQLVNSPIEMSPGELLFEQV